MFTISEYKYCIYVELFFDIWDFWCTSNLILKKSYRDWYALKKKLSNKLIR